MNWKDFQDAVAVLYERAEGMGTVTRDVRIRDKVTGQPRQLDVVVEIVSRGGHLLRVVIDAKFRKRRLDVKDVEEFIGLVQAVGAHKGVLAASSGWTRSAAQRAHHAEVDMVLVTVEQAQELLDESRWAQCPTCEGEWILLDHEVALHSPDDLFVVVLAGGCRRCSTSWIWCWDCGAEFNLRPGEMMTCDCGHVWLGERPVQVRLQGEQRFARLPITAEASSTG